MSSSLARPAAFGVVGATVATFLAASSAPSPLYPAYEQAFGFGPTTLTVVFAVYVLALLAALLVVGRLSDHVGRRPVLAAALALELASLVVFLAASDAGWLVAARVVQGLATGGAIGVLGAYLLDLQPEGTQRGALVNSVAPMAGLAVGGVLAGVLSQYGPAPLRLVYAVLGVAVVVLLVLVRFLPETSATRPGALASMRPEIAVPARARRTFLASTPVFLSTWSLGGLMLSVSGSVLATQLGETNHAVSGVVIALFTGAGATAALLGRDRSSALLARGGLGALVVGVAAFVLALVLSSLALLVVAVVVAGTGFGAAFLGALRSLTSLARPHERSGLMSAVFTVSYLAFSVPALAAGVLTRVVGLHATALGYATVVGVLAATALGADLLVRPPAPADDAVPEDEAVAADGPAETAGSPEQARPCTQTA
ncbi:MFS transporter [Phycicoccus sp. CMS6Z-2]|uniref:MFS transporter n=2 Tax=Phycicoccus flavus TaxID=2502783 RepID=A0A8T6R3H8_9MICO|nr:MFS transporter [Phycicoccus flavus]